MPTPPTSFGFAMLGICFGERFYVGTHLSFMFLPGLSLYDVKT